MAQSPPNRGRWRTEFPYHWDADDLVSRRQLLRFAVFTSGALFASTAAIALVGAVRALRRPASAAVDIASASQVQPGQAIYFEYPEPGEQAVLLRLADGQLVAFSQKCTHLSCSVYYQADRNRLFCPCHEGVFNPATGDPVAGPPQRRLAQIQLQQDGDTIRAVGITP
jgi:Rieske Fe-S protein